MYLKEPLSIDSLILLFFYKDSNPELKVLRYYQHLFLILEKALNFSFNDFLNNSNDKEFLNKIIEYHKNSTSPMSGAFDATLTYQLFPKTVEITHDTNKFKEILREIIKLFIIDYKPELIKKEFTLKDLIKFGFNDSIKYDYDHCYDDYDW